MAAQTQPVAAGIVRRLIAMLYEAFLLFAVMFFAGLAFRGAASAALSGQTLHLFQLYLFLAVGLYFMWCWLRGGQTLAMKAWKLRLESAAGGPMTAAQALARYLLAWISLAAAGTGFLWALFDRDRQFLHDRIAGTRIVVAGVR